MPVHVRNIISHCIWADRRTLRTIEGNERLAADPDLVRILGHVLAAEHLWLSRMRGEPARVAVWPALPLEDCVSLAAECHAELETMASALTTEMIQRQIAYVNSAGESWQSSVEQILTHVGMHGAYHRGQIVKAVRRIGGVPIATDYIVWARTGGAP
jgi:uncharacterized damage-inducible protein DinB